MDDLVLFNGPLKANLRTKYTENFAYRVLFTKFDFFLIMYVNGSIR